MTDARRFIIVGASRTGAKAVQTLREEGFEGSVVLLGEESARPYERRPRRPMVVTWGQRAAGRLIG